MSKAQVNEIRKLQENQQALAQKLSRRERDLTAARKRIKDLAALRCGTLTLDDYVSIAFNDIFTLLLNAVTIKKGDVKAPFMQASFIKKALFCRGQVGYIRSADIWAYIAGEGFNEYGFPPAAVFTSFNKELRRGEISYDKQGELYYLQANEEAYPLVQSILTVCELLGMCDVTIAQNIQAVKVPRFIAVEDDDDVEALKLSLNYANDMIEAGVPVVKISQTMGKALTNIQMPVELIADRIMQLRTEIRNELLTRIGVLTANSAKRERVQVGEVNAHVGECVDNIYITIDAFNAQCEAYGLPYSMELNGVIEDYYEPTETEQDSQKETQSQEEHTE